MVQTKTKTLAAIQVLSHEPENAEESTNGPLELISSGTISTGAHHQVMIISWALRAKDLKVSLWCFGVLRCFKPASSEILIALCFWNRWSFRGVFQEAGRNDISVRLTILPSQSKPAFMAAADPLKNWSDSQTNNLFIQSLSISQLDKSKNVHL